MQVILTEDVKSLGKKGELVNVNDGYARNFILPKKLGLEATKKNINDLKLQKAAEARRVQELLNEALTLKKRIEEGSVLIKIKTGEGGRAFGSISTKEIVAAMKEQMGCEIDKKKLVLSEPIKNLGTYTIPIKIHKDVTAEIKVKIDSL